MDDYLRVIHAAVERDRGGVVEASKALGYLTGYESKVHRSCEAVLVYCLLMLTMSALLANESLSVITQHLTSSLSRRVEGSKGMYRK